MRGKLLCLVQNEVRATCTSAPTWGPSRCEQPPPTPEAGAPPPIMSVPPTSQAAPRPGTAQATKRHLDLASGVTPAGVEVVWLHLGRCNHNLQGDSFS